MELWLRTQHKMALIKSNGIYFKEEHKAFTDGSVIKWYFYDYSSEEVIATYETEERCLEILDEIQKLITDSNKTIITSDIDMATYERLLCDLQNNNIGILMPNDNTQVFPLNTNIVYQMPES